MPFKWSIVAMTQSIKVLLTQAPHFQRTQVIIYITISPPCTIEDNLPSFDANLTISSVKPLQVKHPRYPFL